MNVQKFNYRGTEINKVLFEELEDAMTSLGMNVKESKMLLTDNLESDFAYVSNGFLCGLRQEEITQNEWHHYFIKQNDSSFEAEKFNF